MSTTAGASFSYCVRGLYDHDGDEDFNGRVPSFTTAEECASWVAAHTVCTNPKYPACKQLITTACDWGQVQTLLLEPLAALRRQFPARPPPPASSLRSGNAFVAEAAIRGAVTSRLDLPFHRQMGEESTINTLRYLFFHMRCGIFVAFRRGRLALFVPFVNADYKNTWGSTLATEEPGGISAYADAKRAVLDAAKKDSSKEVLIADPSRWWANGNIMCNVASPSFWSDAYLTQLKDMFLSLAANRDVPDVEFFVNKRDFPQLKRDRTEPYDFLFASDGAPLAREAYATYAPILSFFVGSAFADLPLVTTDDWETATGRVYPPAGIDLRSSKNRQANAVTWSNRVATAFFRGNSTGPGTTVRTNQRLALAALSAAWGKAGSGMASDNPSGDGVPCLDAGVVGWNFRDRKMQGEPMTYIKPDETGLSLVAKVPMYLQMRYKYIVYVEGHCAAARYASMMPLGSVIIKVESTTKADSMWYFPLLKPWDWRSGSTAGSGDHLSVRSDLSDLGAAILWAKTHDRECESIVENAHSLYERLIAKDGQLDYLELLTLEISSRFTPRKNDGFVQPESLGDDDMATHAAVKNGSSPAVLAPRLAEPPGPDGDWFGENNADYCATGLGPLTRAAAPFRRELATIDCACPGCTARRASTEALKAAGARDAAAAEAARAQAAENLRAAYERRTAAAAAVAPKAAPSVMFKDIAKARAAAERAAAAAAARRGSTNQG